MSQNISEQNKFLSDISLQQLAGQKALQNFKIAGGILCGYDDKPSLCALYQTFISSQDKECNIALHVDEHILSVNFKKNQSNQPPIVTVANSSQDGQLTYSITSDNQNIMQANSEINEKITAIINASNKLDKFSSEYQLIQDKFKQNTPISISSKEYNQIVQAFSNLSNAKVFDDTQEITVKSYIEKYLQPIEGQRFKEIMSKLNIDKQYIKTFPSLQQQNNYDCGIYTIYNLLDISKDNEQPTYDVTNINKTREDLELARQLELKKEKLNQLNTQAVKKQNALTQVLKIERKLSFMGINGIEEDNQTLFTPITTKINGTKKEIGQVSQSTTKSFKTKYKDQGLHNLAVDILKKTAKALQGKNITKEDVKQFVHVMRQQIQNHSNCGMSDGEEGKKAGFTAWKNLIQKSLPHDCDQNTTMKKFQTISTEVQNQTEDILHTRQGRKYANGKKVMRSYRLIQMLDPKQKISLNGQTVS